MRILRTLATVLALGLAAPAPADVGWLQPKRDYQADTVMETSEGRMKGRVLASGLKERREFTMQGRQHIMIVRRDQGVSWVLMPEQKLYLESAIGRDGMPQDRFAGGGLEREVLGSEAVNGVAATKYRVHGRTPAGGAFEGTMWMTEDEIPVRVWTGDAGDTVRMELSNLKVGAVAAAEFEIPKGYTRFALPPGAQKALEGMRPR